MTVLASVATMLTACHIVELSPDSSERNGEFRGVIADGVTRSSLKADGDIWHVNWTEGEKIVINGIAYKAAEGGSASTWFVKEGTAENPSAPYTAYSREMLLKGLPAVQEYVPGNVQFIPMMATSDNTTLQFKNLCAILKLNITTSASDAVVKRIELKADQGLSGAFTVTDNAAVVSGTGGVALNCTEGAAIGTEPVPFFISAPANTYTGFSIKLVLTDGRTQTLKLKEGASFKTERSKVYESDFAFNNFTPMEVPAGKATLAAGQTFNASIKKMAKEGAKYSDSDYDITRIIFSACDPSTEGAVVSKSNSDVPVYASFDPVSGVMTISTAADKIYLGANSSYMFAYLRALEAMDNTALLNTESCTDMSYMFRASFCDGSGKLDLSGFNVSKVTTFAYMFYDNLASELDLSTWDTGKATSMSYMLQYCKNLGVLRLGDKFRFPNTTTNPTNFIAGRKAGSFTVRTGTTPGSLTIYCTQDVADWLATTTLRFIHDGSPTGLPIPIHFIDSHTGAELSVTWTPTFPERAPHDKIKYIIETDMGNDIDDALALALALRAVNEGEAEILAIGCHKKSSTPAAYTDAVCTWYGHPEVPVAMSLTPVTENSNTDYTTVEKDFKKSATEYAEPVALYRRILAAQPDSSVTFVSLGFGTTVAQLLDSGPDEYSPLTGVELVAKKTTGLSIMCGNNSSSSSEYNVRNDKPAMKKVFETWPTVIWQNPSPLGGSVTYPGAIINLNLGFDGPNPVVEGYKKYKTMTYDRSSWDILSVLFPLYPELFDTGNPGTVTVSDEGVTRFAENEGGKHYVLKATSSQGTTGILAKIMEMTFRKRWPEVQPY